MGSALPRNLGTGVIAVCSFCFVVVHGLHLVRESESLFVLLAWTLGPLVVSIGLFVFSYWVYKQRYEVRYQIQIAVWFLAGSLILVAFGVLIAINQESMGRGLTDPLYTLVNSATGGAVIGSVIGLYDVRSKRRDDRFVELHDSAQLLLEAETKEEVAQIVVEAVIALLDLQISAIWLAEDGRLVPCAATEMSREVFEEIPVFEEGNSLAWQVFEEQEEQLFSDVGEHPDRYNPETKVSMELVIPLGRHGVMICGSLKQHGLQQYQRELSHLLASYTELVFDRIEQREDLQEREEKLRRQNQRLEEFASVVSHDLQNPLSVITGYLDLARKNPVEENFDHIEDAADRMQVLIEDLLSLARSGERVQDLEVVDLGEVAEEAWLQIQSDSVSLKVADDVGTVHGDRSRLKQLLENLFLNSIEHGGDVTVVRVEWLDDGFAVEDDGMGIPESVRSEMFDFGYTRSTEGSGLGLAIVQEIVTGHGWTVDVEESSEGGARFVIQTS